MALSTGQLPVGVDVRVRYEWEPLAPGLGNVRLFIDDQLVTSAHDVRAAPRGYSMVQEGLSVGRSWGPPVDERHYHGSFDFTGTLDVVELQTDPTAQVALADRG